MIYIGRRPPWRHSLFPQVFLCRIRHKNSEQFWLRELLSVYMPWKYYWGFIVLQSPVCGPRDKAAMLGVNTTEFCSRNIYMKIELTSQRREMLLFLTTNMAAVKSRANQQFFFLFLAVLVRTCPFDGCSLCVSPCWSQSLFPNRSWYYYLFSWICLLDTMQSQNESELSAGSR